jgi:hypothetical protein
VPVRLSTPLIVKNESRVLARCLESLRSWSDELIVMDTGSTDDTLSIAARYADRVCESRQFTRDTPPDQFHFADARNEALSLCSGDWILSVDADEALRGTRLRAWLEETPARCCTIPVRLANFPRHLAHAPRLFRRDGMAWSGRYHDVPTPWDIDHEARVPDSVAWLDNAGLDVQAKLRRNVILLARQIAEEPRNSRNAFLLADTYRGMGPTHFGEAIRYFRLCLDTMGCANAGVRPYVLYALSDCYRALGAIAPALDCATQLTREFPAYERGWVAMGQACECLKQYDRAISCYRRALDVTDPMPLTPAVEAELDRDWIGTRIMCCTVFRFPSGRPDGRPPLAGIGS